MKAEDQPFTRIVNGAAQFVIPVFQRDYSWTEDQCAQLWDDIIRVGTPEKETLHFIGSVVSISADATSAFSRWMLIDGQQRLTTLTLLAAALRDYIITEEWTGTLDDPTPQRIESYFLKNEHESGDRVQKLILRRHDQSTLKSIINRQDLPTDYSARVKENYDFFRERIEETEPGLVFRGIGRLLVVDVTLHRDIDDPQLIFESLNSTGLDLSQSDLIRNYILMRLDHEEQTRLYDSYWSKIERLFRGSESTFDNFARDYTALKTRVSKQEKSSEIYQAFTRFFPDLVESIGSLEDTLQDMLTFARYHAAFSLGRESESSLQKSFASLRRLVDVPALLIMRLYECFKRAQSLSLDEFVNAVELIESYILPRAVGSLQSRSYWQVLAGIGYEIDDERPLESLKVGFALLNETYRFPDNVEFTRELEERDVYRLRVCRHLLEKFENHKNKEPVDVSGYTIEHVMPQNEKLPPEWRSMLGESWEEIHSRWLHKLGNLTLTGYNSTYSDRSFEEKKRIPGGFADSSVRLNRFIREQPKWTEEEIEKRGRLLSEKAVSIWPELVVPAELVEEARLRKMQETAQRRDVNKVPMKPKVRSLFRRLSSQVAEIDEGIVELAERKSVSYHGPNFFMEVLPRANRLNLLLALDFNEVEDGVGLVEDATQWKFFIYAKYSGGVLIQVYDDDDVDRAMPAVRQAFTLSNA